ncbi:ATP-grasp domain-containing protein [Nocardia sp. NPDC006044]|uniref:ATP-grasp domain-containing protein n=1 Tax=Nocardia sp. NPDC006044 TaxID=3364306 RepID=UPI0036C4B397
MIRHFLLIGGARDVTPILRRRRPELRITVLVAVPRLHKIRYPGDCARVIALGDSASIGEWVALARRVHELEPIHAIGAFGEYDQHAAAAIAAALGLPFHAPGVIARVYDKTLMRQQLRAHGVDDTPAAAVDTAQDLKHFADEYGLPLIVKPRSGSGSEHIVRVSTVAELDAALARLDGDRLVERYLDGEEISVEAFSEGGAHRIVGITRKIKDASFVEIGHVVQEATAADDPVAAYVRSVLDALGVAFGPTHTELIRTVDGPRVVETHTRAGGDQIPQLLHAATGIDLVELAVRQSLGARMLPVLDALLAEPGRVSRAGAIRYRVPQARGRLLRVDRLDEATAVAQVTGCAVLKRPGDRLVVPMRDSDDRVAYCTAVAADAESAAAAAEQAAARLEVVIEP